MHRDLCTSVCVLYSLGKQQN